MEQTEHQIRIEKFMRLAKQEVPASPVIPSEKVCKLRAKLIFEEARETIEALGYNIVWNGEELELVSHGRGVDIKEVVDGCGDVSVVNIGTLSAFGIKDKPVLEMVDNNNLSKFGPGHSWNEFGKLIKPPGHTPPDIKGEIERQRSIYS